MIWKRLVIFYSGVLCGILVSAIIAWVVVASLHFNLGHDSSGSVPIAFSPGDDGYEVQLERGQPEFWDNLSDELTGEARRYCKVYGLERIEVDVVARGDHTGFLLNVDVSGSATLSELGEIGVLKSHLTRQVDEWFYDYLDELAKPPEG